MKKFIMVVLIINTSLLLLGGALLGLGLCFGGKPNFSFNLSGKEMVEQVYVDEDFPVEDYSSMKIDVQMAKIYIEKGDENRIEYHIMEELVPEVKVEDNTLYVIQPEKNIIPINFINFNSDEPYIKIYVTEDQYADIKTSSGGIVINNVNIDGIIESLSGGLSINGSEADSIDIKVSSGKTYLENVKYNTIKANQSSGKFVIINCEAGTINTKCLSGGAEFENVSADSIESEVTSGGIHCTNVVAKSADLEATSGSVTLQGSEIIDLTGGSNSGGFKAEDTKIDKANLKVSSGGIRLDLIGDVNDYDFELKVSSGSVNINDEKKGDDYTLENGKDKKIKAKTSSGSINININ
ncbi:MAG: DUF4097 domain-containing protein [Lachnospiraceae bacterium]|nr:DUF4097 domain-containing protein [Lachnospiraceae bacterium]